MHSRPSPQPSLCLSLALPLCASPAPPSRRRRAPAAPTVTPAPNCEKPGDPPSRAPSELGKSAAETKRTQLDRRT